MTSKLRITESGRKVIRLMENFEDVNEAMIETLGSTLVGRRSKYFNPVPKQALILENFNKRFKTQRTFKKLAPSTIKGKEKRNEPLMLVSSEKLKKEVVQTTKGEIRSGNKANFKATVSDYGDFINDGTQKMPQRKFYNFKADRFFQDLSHSILINILRIKGVKPRR